MTMEQYNLVTVLLMKLVDAVPSLPQEELTQRYDDISALAAVLATAIKGGPLTGAVAVKSGGWQEHVK